MHRLHLNAVISAGFRSELMGIAITMYNGLK